MLRTDAAKGRVQNDGGRGMTEGISERIRACTLCADRFSRTATAHSPRPVVWFRPGARILIAGQAPGLRVHESGVPFQDASGDRLRDWMGVSAAEFYDLARVAVVPMAFCFPGYDAGGSDLPPPPLCARTWGREVMATLAALQVRLLIGGAAQAWHLGARGVTETVRRWRDYGPDAFPLPHPSWRNTGWLKRNPWFEADLVPVMQARIRAALSGA